MHIPSHMVSGMVIPATAAAGAAGIAAAAYFAAKSKKKPDTKLFAAVTALIFAAQMMNFPVQSGTSGHLTGTTLAVLLLGAPFGVLSSALVLIVQSVFFSDGGITALGANILNMAVLGAVPAILINRKVSKNNIAKYSAAGAAAWLSVILAALACTLELSISGIIFFGRVFPSMMSIHALIGAGEAAITAVILIAAGKVTRLEAAGISASSDSSTPAFSPAAALTTAAAFTAMFLSPLASSFPDGLERVAAELHFFQESAPLFLSPFPDYNIPFIGSEYFSTGLAGLSGVLIIFAVVFAAGKVSEKKLLPVK